MSESEGDDNDIIVAEEVTIDTQFPVEESANANQNQNRSRNTTSNSGRPIQSSTATAQNTNSGSGNACNENPDCQLRNSCEMNGGYANSSTTDSQDRNTRSNHTRSMNGHGESSSSTPSASAEQRTTGNQSSLDSEMNGALSRGRPDSELSSTTPPANTSTNNNSSRSSAVGSVGHVDTNGIGSAHASSPVGICRSFGECIVIADEGSTHSNGRSTNSNGVTGSSNNRNRSSSSSSTCSSSSQSHPSAAISSLGNPLTTSTSGNGFNSSTTASTTVLPGNGFSTSSDPSTIFPSANGFSTSTPVGGSGRRYSNRDFYPDCDRISEEGTDEEEEEGGDWESYRRRERKRMGNVAGSIFGYAPLVVEGNNEGEVTDPLEELYVPIAGFEVMEQRAKFTVFKLHVQKSANEGYFIFRRYTDFTRLNNKLKLIYPGFRLALPPKKWFGNNFDPNFLEDRMLGLQAFLNNITGHKDIKKSGPVREFLCINDPPGPHDSLEESRVMVDSLEEVVYGLKREVADRDRVMAKKDAEIARLKARIQELENAQVELPGLPVDNERVGTDQESESSTVEGDRRSCVEADLSDHGNSDHNDNGFSDTSENTIKVQVQIEPLGNQPDLKCGKVIGEGDTVAMAISHSAAPVVGDSR